MQRRVKTGAIGVLGLTLLVTGCVKIWQKPPDIRTYMLESRRAEEPVKAPMANLLWIDQVTVLPPYNIRNLVIRQGSEEYQTSYYSEWLISPADNLRNLLYTWFLDSGVFSAVSAGDRKGMTHRLHCTVMKLYGEQESQQAVIRLMVLLIDEEQDGTSILFSKNYEERVPLTEMDERSLIQGYGEALQAILEACEQDVIETLSVQ